MIKATLYKAINVCFQRFTSSAPGADLGFSRGGGRIFKKNFQNFDDLFLLGRPI